MKAPFVVTFYSFKGGVGRTMALANMAVELAQRGRRVLVADFDLEAPGLDTLRLSQPATPVPGVVDYVIDYLKGQESPDFSRYSYEVPKVGGYGGGLWVMPAGLPDDNYPDRLSSIDWSDLYEYHDGFLMFEDLKNQWTQHLAPDYVLIDSRTGHTDEGGICTRHLPDAVFVFFLPNDQNLRGLRPIVKAIREESRGPQRKEILLQFITSNVPDLDDEEGLLGNQLERFKRDLRITDPTSLHTIYRYDSLLLLTQAVFTKDRPRSRLAEQYRKLVDSLIALNPRDRDGVLKILRSRDARRSRSLEAIESQLESIQAAHPDDGEILFALARARLEQGRGQEAQALLDQAISTGFESPEALLERAELQFRSRRRDQVANDVMAALQLDSTDSIQVTRAVNLLRGSHEDRLPDILRTPAVQRLAPQDRMSLAQLLSSTVGELTVGTDLLREALSDCKDERIKRRLRSTLAFNLIAIGHFEEALQEIRVGRSTQDELGIQDAFNAAMAEWGLQGSPSVSSFRAAVATDEGQRSDLNFLQCMALARRIIGDTEHAWQLLSRARQGAMSYRAGSTLLSCWQYRLVSRGRFLRDLDEMERMFQGEAIHPRVLTLSAESAQHD